MGHIIDVKSPIVVKYLYKQIIYLSSTSDILTKQSETLSFLFFSFKLTENDVM